MSPINRNLNSVQSFISLFISACHFLIIFSIINITDELIEMESLYKASTFYLLVTLIIFSILIIDELSMSFISINFHILEDKT